MKRSIICNLITLSCVFFPLILQAQSGWQNAYRIYGCNSIFFADSLTGWYCGYSNKAAGTICMTTDGGRTFQEKYSNPDIDLYKLFFVKQTGYCCGTSGTILKSINGGESWTSMQSNTTVNLYSIFFVDSLYGWACGNNTIVRTTDGGATWIAQVFPNVNASLTDIAFSTSQRGYCVDYHAWIGMNKNYQTTDGGLTWSEIAVPFVDGSTIQLLKPSTVIMGGINGIVVSTDGGVTWNLKWNLGTQYCLINDIAFVDNKLGWAVGDGNVVLQTKDGGQNWEPQFLDARVGGPRALSCADSLHAWFVFYDGIYRTINGRKYQLTSPALLAPANYGTEQSINAVFSWSSIEHTTLYHFQLGNDSLFHSLLIDDSTLGSVSKSVSGLLTNTKYYWRVRAANSNGISEWSEIWQFMTTIGIPFHRSPVDKANDLQLWPSLQWKGDQGASEFHVQVSKDSTFVTSLTVDTTVASNFVTMNGLQETSTYYWRVSAKFNNVYYPWSKPWSFTTGVKNAYSLPLSIGNKWFYYSPAGNGRASRYIVRQIVDSAANGFKKVTITDKYLSGGSYSYTEYWCYSAGKFYINDSPYYSPIILIPNYISSLANDSSAGDYHWHNEQISYFGKKFDSQLFSSYTDMGRNGSITIQTRITNELGYTELQNISSVYGANISSLIGILKNGELIGDSVLAVSSVSKIQSTPCEITLFPNYPNPFNPLTTISFSLPLRSFVSLKIFDVMGKDVATLASEELPAGNYSKQWNASGSPSGVYFYQLKAGTYTETKRLLLLK